MDGAKGQDFLLGLQSGWSAGIKISELGDRRQRSNNGVLKIKVSSYTSMGMGT